MAIIIDFISRGIQTSVYYIKMSVFPHLEGINPFTLYNCPSLQNLAIIIAVSFPPGRLTGKDACLFFLADPALCGCFFYYLCISGLSIQSCNRLKHVAYLLTQSPGYQAPVCQRFPPKRLYEPLSYPVSSAPQG